MNLSLIGSLAITSLLIVITVYDIRHKIIPDNIVYPFIAISLLSIFWKYFFTPGFNIAPAVISGILLSVPFFFLWFFSKGKAMGFGDVKLALGIGWLVGISGSIAVFLLSFWIGAVVGLLLMASSKAEMKSQIPFAPFLLVAYFIVSVWGVNLSTLFPIW